MTTNDTSASGEGLPEPFAWKCIWLMADGESTWEQWHDASDPLPDQWDDEAPDTITEVFTADQLRTAVMAEREACAAICDQAAPLQRSRDAVNTAVGLRDAIRARKDSHAQ